VENVIQRIVNRFTGAIIIEGAFATIKAAVVEFVRKARESGSRADLYGADLSGANLYGADLYGANLYGANLSNAKNLASARLDVIRNDVWAVLASAPGESRAVLEALRAGKVDGSVYHGSCACLVGTIANARGCDITALGDLRPDANRPAERWFTHIRPGHTPQNSEICKLTAEWVEKWLTSVSNAFGPARKQTQTVAVNAVKVSKRKAKKS
jgi:hypothetical protein